MTPQIETSDSDAEEYRASPLAMRLIVGGVLMMVAAAGLMWVKFGPSMFMNLLTAAANCF